MSKLRVFIRCRDPSALISSIGVIAKELEKAFPGSKAFLKSSYGRTTLVVEIPTADERSVVAVCSMVRDLLRLPVRCRKRRVS